MNTQKLQCRSPCRNPFSSLPMPRCFVLLLVFLQIALWSSFNSVQTATVAAKEAQISGSKLVYLTDSNFQDYDEGFLLVLYYADWSGQSRKMFPIWAQLAEDFDSTAPSITVALLDSQEYKENPGSRYVHTLPTIFLFHNGEILSHFVKEHTLGDLKLAVDKFVTLSSEELASSKKLILQELEEGNPVRATNAGDDEMQETLIGLKFESDVLTLTKDNFPLETSNKDSLVMIYTSWCEHCKHFKAAWLALARDPPIPGLLVAKINFESFTTTFPGASLVTGVPTVLFLRNSTVIGKYKGIRKLEDVRAWAKNMAHLSTEEIAYAIADIRVQEKQIERDARNKMIEDQSRSAATNEDFYKIKLLTKENFVEETRGKSALILFYAEKGERSQLMKPVWVALSKYQDLGGLLLARLPEQDDRWSEEMEFIHGYPTVLLARNGIIVERYEGVQELEELHHYALSLLVLSDEEANRKHSHLVQTLQWEKMAQAEKERLYAKSEERRREEEVRKARQLKRKQKSRHGAQ